MNHAEGHALRRLQQGLELPRIAALHKEAVRIVALGQRDPASVYALLSEPVVQSALRRLLAAAVGVGVKGQIDGSGAVAELPKLARIEMGSQRAGDVVKSGLPQHGIVEQALDENHFRIAIGLAPMQYKPPLAPGKNR